jgi:hypothetical protein
MMKNWAPIPISPTLEWVEMGVIVKNIIAITL